MITLARRAVLAAVVALSDDAAGPVTVATVAERVGGHLNRARGHLERLVEEGYAEVIPLPTHGRGRPPKAFAPTVRGRAEANGQATVAGEAELQQLVGAFATYLVGQPEPLKGARDVGREWGDRRARQMNDSVPTGREAPSALAAGDTQNANAQDSATQDSATQAEHLRSLVELLDALGFDPAPAESNAGESLVVLRHCPLMVDSVQDPVVCEMHRGMVEGALRRLGSREGVELTPYSHPEGCELVTHESPVRQCS